MELVLRGRRIERETCPAGSKPGNREVNIGHAQEAKPGCTKGHPEQGNDRVDEVQRRPKQHLEILSDVNLRKMIDRDLQRPGVSDIRRHILVARSVNQRTTMTQVSMQCMSSSQVQL